jgi:hypothetical protein
MVTHTALVPFERLELCKLVAAPCSLARCLIQIENLIQVDSYSNDMINDLESP